MAHVEHFKAPDFARLCNEWARETRADGSYKFRRTGAIDKSRTPDNYALGGSNRPEDMRAALAARLDDVQHSKRRDLNVVSDWVFTCPEELRGDPEQVRRYFEVCRATLADRYGADNLLPASVHLDETSPHMHQPMVPVKDGRVSSKALWTKAELQRVHRALDAALEAEFGRPGLALNGRTKGNYTVPELRARQRDAAALDDLDARLEREYKAQRKRERAIKDREAELAEREKAVEARERAVEARAAYLEGEYIGAFERRLQGLQEAVEAAEVTRRSVEDYGRKRGWPESQFAEPSKRQMERTRAKAVSAVRRATPKGGGGLAAVRAAASELEARWTADRQSEGREH